MKNKGKNQKDFWSLLASASNKLRLIGEFLRIYKRHLHVKGKHFLRIGKKADEICYGILDYLWNGEFYKTSFGNYPQFWARDFGVMTPELLYLGAREEVKKTLEYALAIYEKAGKITTQINPKGKVVNFPDKAYSPDSTAVLFRSIRILNDKTLIKKYSTFLQKEANNFIREVLQKDGRVKRNKHFSGMRDHAIRDASCYDTCMAALMQRESLAIGLKYPIRADYKKILVSDYWKGEFFKDNMSENKISSDANIYPYFYNIIRDKKMLRQTILSIQKAKLDKPFPIKYVTSSQDTGKNIFLERFVKDWESDAIWPWAGLPYIDILSRIDRKKAKFHHDQYRKLIEKYGTFLEVYGRNGTPFKSPFFSSGEGMIWCSMWLRQKDDFKKQ